MSSSKIFFMCLVSACPYYMISMLVTHLPWIATNYNILKHEITLMLHVCVYVFCWEYGWSYMSMDNPQYQDVYVFSTIYHCK